MFGIFANARTASPRLANAAVCVWVVAALALPSATLATWPPCDDFVWAEVDNGTNGPHHAELDEAQNLFAVVNVQGKYCSRKRQTFNLVVLWDGVLCWEVLCLGHRQ